MRRAIRQIAAVLAIMLLMNIPIYAQTQDQATADYLNALGILKGTNTGYDLDGDLNRVQAAVMIVRLRGAEQEALDEGYQHPFKDVPAWGSPYVGYMYHYGLTSGKSATLYGSDDLITMTQYTTFLLRALNYDDQAGDFYWADSLNMARSIGMAIPSSQGTASNFSRAQMIDLTYSALQVHMKSGSKTLLQVLASSDALPPTTDTADLILSYETRSIDKYPSTYQELLDSACKMAYDLTDTYSFNVGALGSVDLDELTEDINESMALLPTYSSVVSGYSLHRLGNTLTITFTYNITRAQHDMALAKAREIIRTIITADMSDYDKEKAIHDYIVDTVVYDEATNPEAYVYTVYGALIKNSAVCHGYAESFRYMGYLAGLEVDLVIGEAEYNGSAVGHAWNIITLDGESYHVDTTWDDPAGGSGDVRSYAYFNVTDEVIGESHTWNRSDYKQCDAATYNYFNYESLQVEGIEGLQDYLQDGFDRGEALMNVKVVGVDMTVTLLRDILLSCDIPYDYSVRYKVNTDTNEVTVRNDA